MREELRLAVMKRAIREVMPFGAGDFTVTEIARAAINVASRPSPEVTALVEAAREILSTKASGYVEPLVYELPFARLAAALAPFTEKEPKP